MVQTEKGSDDNDSLLTHSIGFFLSLLSRIFSFFLGKCIPDMQFCCICFSQEDDFLLLYGSHELPLSPFLPNQPERNSPASLISSCVPGASHSLPVLISCLSVMDLCLGHHTHSLSQRDALCPVIAYISA